MIFNNENKVELRGSMQKPEQTTTKIQNYFIKFENKTKYSNLRFTLSAPRVKCSTTCATQAKTNPALSPSGFLEANRANTGWGGRQRRYNLPMGRAFATHQATAFTTMVPPAQNHMEVCLAYLARGRRRILIPYWCDDELARTGSLLGAGRRNVSL